MEHAIEYFIQKAGWCRGQPLLNKMKLALIIILNISIIIKHKESNRFMILAGRAVMKGKKEKKKKKERDFK